MDVQEMDAGYRLLVEQDVTIPMRDGIGLRANLFRPDAPGRFPVIMTQGRYGKDVHFQEFKPPVYARLLARHPEIGVGSSCQYMNWETVDPERWVPQGYVVMRVDARGSGKSPGLLQAFAPREIHDFYDPIEWAAQQPWSNGKVGLLGISYYAISQWLVASLQPPHLAAIIPWEGAADSYRDMGHHGGIFSNRFVNAWWPKSLLSTQHGCDQSPFVDRQTGKRPTGPKVLDVEQLRANRVDYSAEQKAHPLDDAWHRERTAAFDQITVPLLSVGNWGGLGLHLRGNVEGYVRAASTHKWLRIHGDEHIGEFYLASGIALQRRFFDHFLKGAANGWEREPPIQLAIRRPDGITMRGEQEWPLAGTRWTKYYLNAAGLEIDMQQPTRPSRVGYAALGDGVTFTTAPFEAETEITGPVRLRLWVASSTDDMDLFATLRAFDPRGDEDTFVGANEPQVPVAQGWLRVSHRKTDPCLSTPYRPYHTHDRVERLVPGERYAVDVEIWPTSMVFPRGYRLGLTVQGKDFERGGSAGAFKGSGPFLHDDPDDRNAARFGGMHSIYTGGPHRSYLLLPIIPPNRVPVRI